MSRIKAVFVSLYHYSLVVLNIYLLDFIFTINTDVYLSAFPVMLAMGIAKMGVSAVQKQKADAAERDALIEAGKIGKQIADREFINKFAALQVPTTGTKLKMEEIGRAAQAATEASKEAGARGVIGGTGRTVQGVTNAAAKVAARLEDLQLRIDNKFLTEEQRIGLMNEKKDLQLDYQRLAGAQGAATQFGTQSAQAQAGMMSGFGEVVAGGIQASDLYKGDEGSTMENTNFTANANKGATEAGVNQIQGMQLEPEIDPGPLQLEQNLVSPTGPGSLQLEQNLVSPTEQDDQNKFVDFFRNIFGKDDYFSGLGVSNKTERMLRKEYEI